MFSSTLRVGNKLVLLHSSAGLRGTNYRPHDLSRALSTDTTLLLNKQTNYQQQAWKFTSSNRFNGRHSFSFRCSCRSSFSTNTTCLSNKQLNEQQETSKPASVTSSQQQKLNNEQQATKSTLLNEVENKQESAAASSPAKDSAADDTDALGYKSTPFSDWIKSNQAVEDKPPDNSYRRVNYPDPLSRTVGILKDDIKMFFSNIAFIVKELHKIAKGEKPTHEVELEKRKQRHLQQLELKHKEMSQQQSQQKEQPIEHQQDTSTTLHLSKELPFFNPILSKTYDDPLEYLQLQKQRSKDAPQSAGVHNRRNKLRNMLRRLSPMNKKIWQGHCDIVIVGGGAVGSAIAYHLKKNGTDGINVVVVEKDPSYENSSSVLSVGGIKQQFSLPENILLSMYGMQFMRDIPRLLVVDDELPSTVNFQPHGSLTLATERGLQQLKENLYVQQHFKAQVKYMEPSALKAQFPWLNVDDIAGGVLGLENEGWFDPWKLVLGLRQKAISLGVHYVEAEMVGVEYKETYTDTYSDGHPVSSDIKLNNIVVRMPEGEERTITAAAVVLATGHSTGQICYDMMGIGKAEEGIMAYPVPIEPRKRYVYCFHAPKGPGLAAPHVLDPSGAHFRREGLGNMFLGSMSPHEDQEPSCDNLEVDHEYFRQHLWPVLANRVPAFQDITVQGSWATLHEHNVFDENGIIGAHPLIGNLLLAAGFSGHGIQHSLGVGRAVMELLLRSEYKTIDLSRFHLERIQLNEPVYESVIL